MSDQKIKTALAKALFGLIPMRALTGVARVFAYGARKYLPGNYHSATLDDGAGQRYVSAAQRHLAEMQLPNGLHTPESLAALDPESGLPHIDHVICGMIMLRSIMVKCGALAEDPGVGLEPPSAVAPVELAKIEPAPRPRYEVVPRAEINGRPAEFWARIDAETFAAEYNSGARDDFKGEDPSTASTSYRWAIVDNGDPDAGKIGY